MTPIIASPCNLCIHSSLYEKAMCRSKEAKNKSITPYFSAPKKKIDQNVSNKNNDNEMSSNLLNVSNHNTQSCIGEIDLVGKCDDNDSTAMFINNSPQPMLPMTKKKCQ